MSDVVRNLDPTGRFEEGWIVGGEALELDGELGYGYEVAYLDQPDISPETPGLFLMRVCLTAEEVKQSADGIATVVYMPGVRSRPYETVWTNTELSKRAREMIARNPKRWPVS